MIPKIVDDFQVNRANLCSYRNNSIKNFHNGVAILLLKKLITEIEESFNTCVFQIIDAFQVLNPINIPINLN